MSHIKDSHVKSRISDPAQPPPKEIPQGISNTDGLWEILDGHEKGVNTRLRDHQYRHIMYNKDEREGRTLLDLIISRLRSLTSSEDNDKRQRLVELATFIASEKPEFLNTANPTARITSFLLGAEIAIDLIVSILNLIVPSDLLPSIHEKCDEKQQANCLLQMAIHRHRLNSCIGKGTEPEAKLPFRSDTVSRPGQLSADPDHAGTNNTKPQRSAKKETAAVANDEEILTTSGCIHDLVDTKKIERADKDLQDVLKTALGKDPQSGKSCLDRLLVVSNFDCEDTAILPIPAFRTLLRLCPPEVIKAWNPEGYTPLQKLVCLYKGQKVNYGHLSLIAEELVVKFPKSIYDKVRSDSKNYAGKTANGILRELRDEAATGNRKAASGDLEGKTKEAMLQAIHHTEELFKRTCIGDPDAKDKDDKCAFLYGGDAKAVKNFTFNLQGELCTIDDNYIQIARKQSRVRFETVLDFVKLPYWNPPTDISGSDEGIRAKEGDATKTTSNKNGKHDPYIHVFDWLWDAGVRKIFKINVEDRGEIPHSNAAIRQCLKGSKDDREFEVEVWDWKKYDMCGDTIYTAAKNAKEVHLYSSGNIAVLRGWTCGQGISQMPNLRHLIINIEPKNKKDGEDCRSYYKHEFEPFLSKKCPNLKTEYNYTESELPPHSPMDDNQGNDAATSDNHALNGEKWIEKMENYRKLIRELSREVKTEKSKPVVKVAILDSGAWLRNQKPSYSIQSRSFRTDSVEAWVGSCSHGTDMLDCILDVCPFAEVYIARLDDCAVTDKQKFTTISCYKALQWALEIDVDIISMSWTFEGSGGKDISDAETKFKSELARAVSKEKIIFTSLPDRTVEVIESHLPVGFSGVVRIGSADYDGDHQIKENRFANPDFLLPGVGMRRMEGTGSSYATALASGLAALILYGFRLHKTLDSESKTTYQKETLEKRAREAATVNSMKNIFKTLSKNAPEDPMPGHGCLVRPFLLLKTDKDIQRPDKVAKLENINSVLLPGE